MPIKFAARFLLCTALLGVCCPLAAAQQTPPPSNPESSSQAPVQQNPSTEPQAGEPKKPADSSSSSSSANQDQSKPKESVPGSSTPEGKVAGTSNDRLFYALPNFLSLENAGNVPPLTTKEKYAVVARGSFDYIQIPWYGFLAGISQAENSEPGYGQGAEGYGKRFGAGFADGTIENFMTGAILPSILREDPRFFQLGHGSFMHRTFYAISRNIVTRTDSGRKQFNYSEVVGGALSAAISTYSYHPKADKTVGNTAKVWGTQFGYDTLTIVVKEFWPDIHRKIQNRHHRDNAPAATPGP